MIIEIEALDTLFFRDGKPFTMGAENWANGLFPPPPSVIYGALRSNYFSLHPEELIFANTVDDPTENLIIKGMALSIKKEFENEICFPLPFDLFKLKNKKEKKCFPLFLKKNYLTSSSTKFILSSEFEEIEKMDDGLLDCISIKEYLQQKEDIFYYKNLSEYVLSEPRIGIKRNNQTLIVEEKMLYRVGFNRLASKMEQKRKSSNLNIIVEFEGLNIPEKGFLKLGKEGKVAVYHKKVDTVLKNDINVKGECFKLYLITPAIFDQGWLPKWVNEKTHEGSFKGLNIKLLGAAVGRYINIGGFDIANKRPKRMYRAVPAGSVYYFKVNNKKDVKKVMDIFHYQSISDYKQKEGYGITFVGGFEK